MNEEIRDKQVTVRKDHQCGWCGEKINRGEKAQYRFYLWEGDPVSEWQHPECHTAMLAAPPDHPLYDGGYEMGEFHRGTCESIHEQ